MIYTLQDDQGIMEQGSLKSCVLAVTNWLSTREAKELYRVEELRAAKQLFYAALETQTKKQISALGFTISAA